MSRPKVKGASIAIRLPVHLHDMLIIVARQENMTPRDYVDNVMQHHLENLSHNDPKAAAAVHGVETSSAGAALLAEYGSSR